MYNNNQPEHIRILFNIDLVSLDTESCRKIHFKKSPRLQSPVQNPVPKSDEF